MTAHGDARQHQDGTVGGRRQPTGIVPGLTFKRARRDHPGLRKELRVQIPIPPVHRASRHHAVDEGLLLDNAGGDDTLDLTADVLEAGRWQLEHMLDASWSSPCTLPRPNDLDEEEDDDVLGISIIGANESAGPGDLVVMDFLIDGSDGGDKARDENHCVHVDFGGTCFIRETSSIQDPPTPPNPSHPSLPVSTVIQVDLSLMEPTCNEAALQDEPTLDIWLHGLQGPADDVTADDHATGLVEEEPLPALCASSSLSVEDAVVVTQVVEAPPPVAPDSTETSR